MKKSLLMLSVGRKVNNNNEKMWFLAVEWIELAHSKSQWQDLANKILSLPSL
jgi:hypothetical protein